MNPTPKPVQGRSSAVAFIDGGSHKKRRDKQGSSGIGIVIRFSNGTIARISDHIGRCDNNYAEYAALRAALVHAADNGVSELCVYSDSDVVVRQINGLYQCRNPRLRPIYEHCRNATKAFSRFEISHISREKNSEANRLAQRAARGEHSEFVLSGE